MDKGTVKEIAFFSNVLQEEFELLIYIPANYSPLNEYNILIASDGRDYFQLGGIPRLADKLIDDYIIENVIIVGVPYKDVYDRKRKYIPTGNQYHAYMQFLAEELIAYLDEEFATIKTPESRALIGDSMAATISLLTTVNYPYVFGKAILQSPYVDEQVMNEVRNASNTESLQLYHIIGLREDKVLTTDKTIKDFLTPNRALHELIGELGIPCFYEEIEGNHTWKYWKTDLQRALIEIFG